MTAKDSGIRIRVQRELRDQFLDVCRAQDRPAAQVLREFMRTYIDQHTADRSIRPGNTKQRKQGGLHEH